MKNCSSKINRRNKLISLAVVVILGACQPAKDNSSEDSRGNIVVVNHRGANRLAPECTYAAAKKSIEHGATYIEIDIRRSKDGVYYIIHDRQLDRTTNGSGLISETESAVIDTLDAGAWFAHKYKGEKVPRLREFLQWVKGKAKVYFDVKDVDLKDFIPIVYEYGFENECFFWFSDWALAKEFRGLHPHLALKVNAYSVEALDSLKRIYNPQIIECSVDNLTEEFMHSCREKGMKIMTWIPGNDWAAYRMAIDKKVDMVNIDNPDVFEGMLKNNREVKGYKLIAHRGGIVEGKYNEFDPASIQAAIDQGYYMLEIDVRETKDGELIVNHDDNFDRFFNDPRRVGEMTWAEIQKLKSENGNYHPPSFEQVAEMCAGKVEMMIDVKADNSSPEFYRKLEAIMEKYNLLEGAYFIDNEARKYFWGKAKFMIRAPEAGLIREKFESGEDVSCHYFLFDAGTRLTSSLVKMCQKANITVVPSVNFGHYHFEDARRGAKRDIEFLKACGVTEFQIDSDFDGWLPTK
jgi:glycerophosphoryl diester phosphodiesterase